MAGFFDTLFSGGAEREAADRNRALTSQYGTDAQGYLKTGYDTGVGNINSAIGAYQPLSDLAAGYNKGGSMYLDALGVNGPEGNTRATGAFQNNPGYQGAVTAGLDILNRRRAGQGMAASGNADIDALTFGQNLQNQQYGDWMTRLAGAGNTGVQATGAVAGGQAGQYDNLANLAQKYAGDQTGVVGNQLSSNVNSSNLQAQGEASGAKNLLGAGLSLASLAAGGGGMGGGLGSALFGGNTPAGQTFQPGLFQGGSYGQGGLFGANVANGATYRPGLFG
jgi:hypothetical protein